MQNVKTLADVTLVDVPLTAISIKIIYCQSSVLYSMYKLPSNSRDAHL